MQITQTPHILSKSQLYGKYRNLECACFINLLNNCVVRVLNTQITQMPQYGESRNLEFS